MEIKKLLFILKVIEIRLRFVAVLFITALVVGYWGTIQNYYERWTRPLPSQAGLAVGEEAHAESDTEYFCPMHTFVVRNAPGNCPICGMTLSPRKKHAPSATSEGAAGRVQVSPERILQAGVKIEPVEYRRLIRQVRTYGAVEADESRVARVTARFPGRVEQLIVNTTGVEVKQGEPLAKFYSPKYLAATYEYLQALEALARIEADPKAGNEANRIGAELAASAHKPLERQGFTPEQLDALAQTGKTSDRITLFSPVSGTVLEKNILEGESVDESAVLYTIADLSTVWVLAEVAESDLAAIRSGMMAEITTVARPGETFQGTVSLIYPTVNAESRSVKARIVIPKNEGKLKPGMFINATINASVDPSSGPSPTSGGEGGGVLAVPESAVIDTGARQIVYVESAPGIFDARVVTLGARAGEFYPVIRGLSVGERVAGRGSFLIDAEARLNPMQN